MSRLRTLDRSQLVCRVLLVVLPLTALLLAPTDPSVGFGCGVVGAGIGWAVWPESAVGPVLLLAVMVWWVQAVDDPVRLTAVVAAGLLAAAHWASVLASYGPARSVLDRRLVLMCLRRGVLSFLAAPLAYLVLVGLGSAPGQSAMWPLAVATLVMLGLGVGLRLREPTSPQAPAQSVER